MKSRMVRRYEYIAGPNNNACEPGQRIVWGTCAKWDKELQEELEYYADLDKRGALNPRYINPLYGDSIRIESVVLLVGQVPACYMCSANFH